MSCFRNDKAFAQAALSVYRQRNFFEKWKNKSNTEADIAYSPGCFLKSKGGPKGGSNRGRRPETISLNSRETTTEIGVQTGDELLKGLRRRRMKATVSEATPSQSGVTETDYLLTHSSSSEPMSDHSDEDLEELLSTAYSSRDSFSSQPLTPPPPPPPILSAEEENHSVQTFQAYLKSKGLKLDMDSVQSSVV